MKKIEKINIILGLVFSFILVLSFLFLAGFNLNKKIVNIQHEFSVQSKTFSQAINLPQKSNYLLQLKYEYKNTDAEVVSLNGKRLELKLSNRGKDIISRYYFIPKHIVRKDRNRIDIKFYGGHPLNIDVRIRDYIFSAANGNVIFTIKKSFLNSEEFMSLLFGGILFFLSVFCLWKGLGWLGEWIFGLHLHQSILNSVVSFIPGALLFFVLGINSFKGPYCFVIEPFLLFWFLFVGVILINLALNFLFLFIIRSAGGYLNASPGVSENHSTVVARDTPDCFIKGLQWLKTREFSDKCILFFMFLLILCAFVLILGMEVWAEQLANIAYFALLSGVLLKLLKCIRQK